MKSDVAFKGVLISMYLDEFFFSRTNELISTKLDTKPPQVKKNHVCSKESFSKRWYKHNSENILTTFTA